MNIELAIDELRALSQGKGWVVERKDARGKARVEVRPEYGYRTCKTPQAWMQECERIAEFVRASGYECRTVMCSFYQFVRVERKM